MWSACVIFRDDAVFDFGSWAAWEGHPPLKDIAYPLTRQFLALPTTGRLAEFEIHRRNGVRIAHQGTYEKRFGGAGVMIHQGVLNRRWLGVSSDVVRQNAAGALSGSVNSWPGKSLPACNQ